MSGRKKSTKKTLDTEIKKLEDDSEGDALEDFWFSTLLHNDFSWSSRYQRKRVHRKEKNGPEVLVVLKELKRNNTRICSKEEFIAFVFLVIVSLGFCDTKVMTHVNQALVNFERRDNSTLDALVLFSNRDPTPQDTTTQDFLMNSLTNSSEEVLSNNYDSLVSNLTPNKIMSSHEIPYLVNVTADVPIEYAMVMFGYIMPLLLILTIIANTLVVIVLSRKHMITPTNIVLLAMAISDMLTLLFPAPWYFYMYTLGNHDKILFPTAACYAFHCMIEVIPAFFHTASIWLTLLLAVQRYIYVCHPTLARTWCTG